jgi:hypothetical protein
VSFVGRGADGIETSTYGLEPLGYLMYGKGGHMSVQIARFDRTPFKSSDPSRASPEELKNAIDGYFGYFGRYTVDDRARTVTHHVESCSIQTSSAQISGAFSHGRAISAHHPSGRAGPT